jgi:hypothetical protein
VAKPANEDILAESRMVWQCIYDGVSRAVDCEALLFTIQGEVDRLPSGLGFLRVQSLALEVQSVNEAGIAGRHSDAPIRKVSFGESIPPTFDARVVSSGFNCAPTLKGADGVAVSVAHDSLENGRVQSDAAPGVHVLARGLSQNGADEPPSGVGMK